MSLLTEESGRKTRSDDPPQRVPFTRDPIARQHLARLSAEVDDLRADLAARDRWIVMLEDEIDALRWTLGHAEIPL